MQFADCNIAVLNSGPVDPQPGMWYDGKPRRFPIGRAIIVSAIEAYHHFGVEVRGGKLVRDKSPTNPDGTQTQYANRCASLYPYGLVHGRPEDRNKEEFEAMKKWFDDGLDFKLVKTTKELDAAEFQRLK
jgi:hypothetical protein